MREENRKVWWKFLKLLPPGDNDIIQWDTGAASVDSVGVSTGLGSNIRRSDSADVLSLGYQLSEVDLEKISGLQQDQARRSCGRVSQLSGCPSEEYLIWNPCPWVHLFFLPVQRFSTELRTPVEENSVFRASGDVIFRWIAVKKCTDLQLGTGLAALLVVDQVSSFLAWKDIFFGIPRRQKESDSRVGTVDIICKQLATLCKQKNTRANQVRM